MDGARPPGTSQDNKWNHQREKEWTFPRGVRRLSWYCPETWGRRHKVQSNFKSGGYGFLFFLIYTSCFLFCFFGWRTSWMVSDACELWKPSLGNKVRLLGVLWLEAIALEQVDLSLPPGYNHVSTARFLCLLFFNCLQLEKSPEVAVRKARQFLLTL